MTRESRPPKGVATAIRSADGVGIETMAWSRSDWIDWWNGMTDRDRRHTWLYITLDFPAFHKYASDYASWFYASLPGIVPSAGPLLDTMPMTIAMRETLKAHMALAGMTMDGVP